MSLAVVSYMPDVNMKQFDSNRHQLSVVQNERAIARFDVSGLDHGWWDALYEDELLSMSEKTEAAIALWHQRPIRSIDAIRIDRATVREGKTHRYWPREVVEKFLAAEVIRSNIL
ncbi:MAG: hypothetical protein H0U60_10540 [Blastocatellia bacterium]|nr:hypothetical protein [Blastocatellia bacterium]